MTKLIKPELTPPHGSHLKSLLVKETDKPAYCYREGRWKVIYRQEEDTWELCDLKEDPQEKDNRIDSATETERMKQALQPRVDREHL